MASSSPPTLGKSADEISQSDGDRTRSPAEFPTLSDKMGEFYQSA